MAQTLRTRTALAAAVVCALASCAVLLRGARPGFTPVSLVVIDHVPPLHPRSGIVNHRMPPALDSQSCIKAGATCTIRVAGGYLKLTDIAFPDGESKPGSATADGVVKGKHVHGVVKLRGNQLPLGHFVPAREDAEPYIAARQQADEQAAGAATGSPLDDGAAGLPGNASAIQRFSAKYGGTILKRSRADLRRGGGLDSQYTKAMRTIVGNLRRQHEKVGAHSPSAAFWCPTSSAMPWPASSIRRSSAARSKVAPSAVAWTSTIRPLPVMTKLASACALESSA